MELRKSKAAGGADLSNLLSSSSTFHTCPTRATADSANLSLCSTKFTLPCTVQSRLQSPCKDSRPRIRKQQSTCLRHFPKPQGWSLGYSLFESGRAELPGPNTIRCTNCSLRTPLRMHIWYGNMHLTAGLVLLGTVINLQEPKSKLTCPLSCTQVQCADGQRQRANDV